MKKTLARLALILVAAMPAVAQQLVVTGSRLTDHTGARASGRLCFAPTDGNGNAISVVAQNGGQVVSTPACTTVTNGAFSITLLDTALTNPFNFCYAVTLTTTGSGTSLLQPVSAYACYQPSANGQANRSPNFDYFIPGNTGPALVVAGPQGPPGPSGTVIPATSTTRGSVMLASGPQNSTAENAANRNIPLGYAPLDGNGLLPLANLPTIPFTQLSGVQAALGFTPENTAAKGAANGYAPLDASAHILTANLPTISISQLTGVQAALGFTPENTANKGAASGYAPLDASSKVPLVNVPTIPISQVSGAQASLGFTPENVANKNAASGYAGLDASGLISLSAIPTLNISKLSGVQASLGYTPENVANRNAANGYAPLDQNALVPLTSLPTIPLTQISGAQPALGFTPENAANKGAASGYAPLDSNSLLPLANLPTIPVAQVSGAQASLGFTPVNPANNLSDLASASTARTNLGLGAAAALGATGGGTTVPTVPTTTPGAGNAVLWGAGGTISDAGFAPLSLSSTGTQALSGSLTAPSGKEISVLGSGHLNTGTAGLFLNETGVFNSSYSDANSGSGTYASVNAGYASCGVNGFGDACLGVRAGQQWGANTTYSIAIGYDSARTAIMGSGATLTATMGVVLVSSTGGSGYSSNQTCTLSGGGGTGAAVSAVASGGSITYTVTPGSGYTSVPTPSCSGGGGTGAAPTLALGLVAITYTAAGTGYAKSAVYFGNYSGGGGTTTAQFFAMTDSSGTFSQAGNYLITVPGAFTGVPTLSLGAGQNNIAVGYMSMGGLNTSQQLSPNNEVEIGVASGENEGSAWQNGVTVAVTNGGSYGGTPTCSVAFTTPGSGSGASCSLSMSAGAVSSVTVNAGNGLYPFNAGPSITFSGGSPTTSATATASMTPTYAQVAYENTYVGWNTGVQNITGQRNTFIGSAAGQFEVNGSANVGIGRGALNGSTQGSQQWTGNYDTAIGHAAGNSLITPASNDNFFGNGAGDGNGVAGYTQPSTGISGSNNQFLGTNSGTAPASAGVSNSDCIGEYCVIGAYNSMYFGAPRNAPSAMANGVKKLGVAMPFANGVSAISITAAGSGYTSGVTWSFSNCPVQPIIQTALNASNGLTTPTILSPGQCSAGTTAVTITPVGAGSGATATATITANMVSAPRAWLDVNGNIATPLVTPSAGTTVNLDWSAGNLFEITLTGATTFTVTNAPSGQMVGVIICEPSTAYAVTWPGTFRGAMSITAASTASKCYEQQFAFDGTNYFGFGSNGPN